VGWSSRRARSNAACHTSSSIASTPRSCRTRTAVAVKVFDTEASSKDAPQTLTLPPAGTDPKELLWAIRLPASSSALPEVGRSPVLFTGELSLLDRELGRLFQSPTGTSEPRLIARNPFSDGRLDGSRFAATTMLAGPGAGPIDLRRMHADFDPVLALGFLTKDRRRTLAQAALHFVLGWPWVATSVVPLPNPERFEEILGFAASTSLTVEELDRLGLVK
jgi:aryl-alcohol dehydrogenase-like predicted oxidoreductase